jgi:actin-like ATPase involved in cell morphogenesis
VSYSLGVDLGTTFVAAAVARDDRVKMAALGERSLVTPSVVYVRNDGALLAGEPAGRRMLSNPDHVASEMKRRLGDPTPLVLGGAAYPVTDLLGTLLRDVLDRVAAEEGGPPERLILTHPANWGPYQRTLFAEVARFAGVTRWWTVTEPEAAAAHYAATHTMAVGEVIAVYDLGGGTFDATVVRRTENGIEVLGTPHGIERLGGADLDEAILSFVNHATGGALTALNMGDASTVVALARLRQDCVLAKEALSVDTEATIPVSLPGRHLEVQLSRRQFEDIIRTLVESTIGALSRALHSASITPDRLSTVLMVGGSSHIPLVRRMLEEHLRCRTVVDAHPKHAVALGAATLIRSAWGADSGTPAMPQLVEHVAAPEPPAAGGTEAGTTTGAANAGRRRRRVTLAAGLLLLAGAGTGLGASLSQDATGGQQQHAAVAAPSSGSPGSGGTATRAVVLPTDVPGLIKALTADSSLAGARTQPLVAQLGAVATRVGEERRQAALRALGIVGGAGVHADLASAVTTAVSPVTVLNTPADLIADLQPNPRLGGPNAGLLLGCMQEFRGHTPQQQQQEAQETLASLPAWAASGGIRADLVDAAVRIVTPVAQGRKVFNDVEAAGGTAATPGGG